MVNFNKRIALIVGIIVLIVLIAGSYLIFANSTVNKEEISGSKCNECEVTNSSDLVHNNASNVNQNKNITDNGNNNNSSSKSCCK